MTEKVNRFPQAADTDIDLKRYRRMPGAGGRLPLQSLYAAGL